MRKIEFLITNGGREKFTPKRKVLKVDHHLSGYIAVKSDSRILLLYSNNATSYESSKHFYKVMRMNLQGNKILLI